jgi:hypothetical protein
MSNVLKHAEKEIELLLKSNEDATIKDFVPEILALVEKFGNSGQSGSSAPYVSSIIASTIKKLCMFETLSPLTGEDDEWTKVSTGLFQNNRNYAVFKDDNNKAYYLDAIVWETQNDIAYSGTAIAPNGEIIYSRQYIKSFPFEPKIFRIEVTEKKDEDGYKFFINNNDSLNEVFEYYEKY